VGNTVFNIGKSGSPVNGVFIKQSASDSMDMSTGFYNSGEIYLEIASGSSNGNITVPTFDIGSNNATLIAPDDVNWGANAIQAGNLWVKELNPDNNNLTNISASGLLTLEKSAGDWAFNTTMTIPTGQDVELKSAANSISFDNSTVITSDAKLIVNAAGTISVVSTAGNITADDLVLLTGTGNITLAATTNSFNTLVAHAGGTSTVSVSNTKDFDISPNGGNINGGTYNPGISAVTQITLNAGNNTIAGTGKIKTNLMI